MSNILIGFIGRGRVPSEQERAAGSVTRAGYVKTIYAFDTENDHSTSQVETSLFSSALLQRMKATGETPDRWLVMGTPQSNWADLIEAVPDDKQNDLLEHFDRVYQEIKEGSASQETLNEWESALSSAMRPTRVICRLVGNCDTYDSQLKVWQALNDCVQKADRIFMDITHGFRHQPVITTFMIMLLRWIRQLKSIEMYYGAFEMKGRQLSCPVLKLPLCNELLKATEAIATYQYTGNYYEMGELLDLGKEFDINLGEVVFAGETNRQARNAAHRVQQILNETQPNFDPIQQVLYDYLQEPLQWLAGESLAHRMGYKARFAFEHGQYLKAIALLWEAIRIAACDLYRIPNLMEFQSRMEAEALLYRRRSKDEKEVLKDVEGLRNGVLHASHTNRATVADALQAPSKFRKIFKAGYHLLDTLLQEIEETTP